MKKFLLAKNLLWQTNAVIKKKLTAKSIKEINLYKLLMYGNKFKFTYFYIVLKV